MPNDPAPNIQFCDLVMKGGITSGVVYPRAIRVLAERYHFKNIGGTSAGAIAAVATAAAEYQRRQTGSFAGFEALEKLPTQLGEPRVCSTFLLRLFQPSPRCARLFSVLVGALNHASARSAVPAVLVAVLRAYIACLGFGGIFAGLLLVLLGTNLAGILAALSLGSGLCVVLLVGALWYDVSHNLVDNQYGLCRGMTQPGFSNEALSPWLHGLIQHLAGGDRSTPLTFAELWDAPGEPTASKAAAPERDRSIDLRMFTTNLHHGRPYLLPCDGVLERLYFKKSDLYPVLPHEVVDWMFEHGAKYTPKSQFEPPASSPALQQHIAELRELTPDNFPIVFAARLSLSFPVLLSTVQLWVMDFDAAPEERTFRPCLFSDGGLCANFPIHLFDALLPAWPTFGIQFEPPQPAWAQFGDDGVFLPKRYEEGIGESWNDFDRKPDAPAKLFGFFAALLDSMQNWNDNALTRLPGVRDRVVHVRLKEGEGGLNLNMPAADIAKLADRGAQAAHELAARFADDGSQGWDDHRFTRLGVLAQVLTGKLQELTNKAGQIPNSDAYAALLAEFQVRVPPSFARPLTADERAAIQTIVDELTNGAPPLGQRVAAFEFDAVPKAAARIRPTI